MTDTTTGTPPADDTAATAPTTAAPPPTPRPAAAAEKPAEHPELATLREQAQQLTAQAETAQQRAERAELDLARLTSIRSAHLPDALAARLHGASEDELKADAAALAEIITALIDAAAPPARAATAQPVEALRPAASAPIEPVEDTPEQISRLVWGS
ncbi:hypothetical protein [Amycolatopsis sp. cmx-4-54]|uniref:hypothetical protein n=1 Tax=Amycolatopsis sp. cmx-4-54 TaxID=2790936 RepID=UPI00397CF750